MKERPILFSGTMIHAILAGQKTQTRRLVKPIPQMVTDKRIVTWEGDATALMQLLDQVGRACPYGQPGGQLWVREAYADIGCRLTYRADQDDGAHCAVKRWTPSIHMPRAASRILLKIVSVRVERLQDISEADAEAEGIDFLRHIQDNDETLTDRDVYQCLRDLTARDLYELLWESINGEGSWAANPWVWVVEFKRIEATP